MLTRSLVACRGVFGVGLLVTAACGTASEPRELPPAGGGATGGTPWNGGPTGGTLVLSGAGSAATSAVSGVGGIVAGGGMAGTGGAAGTIIGGTAGTGGIESGVAAAGGMPALTGGAGTVSVSGGMGGAVVTTGGAPVVTGGNAGTGTTTGGMAGTGGLTGGTAGTGGVVGVPTLVSSLEISKVSLYQTVEIPLMQNWSEATDRPADVTQGKDALVRVFVKRQAGWAARAVRAEVQVMSSGGDVTLTAERTISDDSTDERLDSTLNVDIPAAQLSGDATYRVSLMEAGSAGGGGDTTRAQWPESGSASIGERSLGGGLKIRLVPIRYDADGSGRLPDTSEAQLNLYRQYFTKHYPVPWDALDLTFTEALPWSNGVDASGSGWDSLLYEVTDFMDRRGAADDEYYFGLVSPDTSFERYCSWSCVAGLAFEANSPNSFSRINAGVGVGFTGEYSAGTAVHEVGHQHGRLHAPCDVSDPDPNYPFPDGRIGVWGYDLIEGMLKEPTLSDFMGYCPEVWASAYTYQGIFDWMVATNTSLRVLGKPTEWQSIRVSSSGEIRLGRSYELAGPPQGCEMDVEWLDADRNVVERSVGYLTPFDSLPGGVVFVRMPGPDAAYVRIDGSAPVAL